MTTEEFEALTSSGKQKWVFVHRDRRDGEIYAGLIVRTDDEATAVRIGREYFNLDVIRAMPIGNEIFARFDKDEYYDPAIGGPCLRVGCTSKTVWQRALGNSGMRCLRGVFCEKHEAER